MNGKHTLPADIERTSMAIITQELAAAGIELPPQHAAVVKRVIHTTADFDYAQSLCFTPDAVARGVAALRQGVPIVTDTNMAKAGVSKPSLAKLGGTVACFMADGDVARAAQENGTTRADAAMEKAAREYPGAVLAVGNAPTALLRLEALIADGLRPALVVAVLVTSVLVASFGQGGKPSDNVANDPQQSEIVTPDDTETPTDETPDAETPSDDQQTPADNAETPSSGTTGGKQEINPSTGKDKYQTDPVPEGKPTPTEPEDTTVDTSKQHTCTISITCKTILDNMDKVKESKKSIVPSNGVILGTTTVTFSEGESVFDVLQRVCRERGIHMDSNFTPMYNSAYVKGIANLYEFDVGSQSGWMYKVNGWFPNYGCSRYTVQQGDEICWMYTCVGLGEDIGGGYAMGG